MSIVIDLGNISGFSNLDFTSVWIDKVNGVSVLIGNKGNDAGAVINGKVSAFYQFFVFFCSIPAKDAKELGLIYRNILDIAGSSAGSGRFLTIGYCSGSG